MQWEFIVALVLAIPVILFPVAFVWYLNIGGIYHAIQVARQRRAAAEDKTEVVAKAEQYVATAATKEQRARKWK